MSLSEDICFNSLQLILHSRETVLRNYRPDWLKNEKTGRNLELDFYLPECRVGIEIQGQHHYEETKQIERDKLKLKLLQDNKVDLIKLSIFQINPTVLYRKLAKLNKEKRKGILLRDFDASWVKEHKNTLEYKKLIKNLYGAEQDCYYHPKKFEDKQRLLELNEKLKYAYIIHISLRGKIVKAKILDLTATQKALVQVLKSREKISIKKSKIILKLNGDEIDSTDRKRDL